MKITDRVRRKIERDFPPEQSSEVIAALEGKDLPLINNNGERVHLAILKLAQGNLQKFKHELHASSIDWRDTLMTAGMGYGGDQALAWLVREEEGESE